MLEAIFPAADPTVLVRKEVVLWNSTQSAWYLLIVIFSAFIFVLCSLLATYFQLRGLVLLIRSARPRSDTLPTRREQLAAGLTSLAFGCGFGGICGFIFSDSNNRSSHDSAPLEKSAILGLLYFTTILAIWAYRGDASRGRHRCPKCLYDMSASKLTCPECGHTANQERQLLRSRPRRRAVTSIVTTFLLLYGAVLAGRIYNGGPIAAIPNWILIAGMSSFPDYMIIEDDNPSHEDWSLLARTQRDRLYPWERPLVLSQAQPVAIFGDRHSKPRMQQFVDQLGPEVAAAIEMGMLRGIASPDHEIRECAAFRDLRDMPPCHTPPLTEAVRPLETALVAALDDPTKEVRGLAASYLTELGNGADQYVPKMLENLAIPTKATINMHSVQDLTPHAIERRAVASDNSLQLLLAATRGPDNTLAWKATRLLSRPGIFDRGGKERLFELVNHPDIERAWTAADELSSAPIDKTITLPILIDFTLTRNPGAEIFYTLRMYEDLLIPYLPQLLPFLDSDDPKVQTEMVSTLAGLYANNSIDESWILPQLERIAAEAPRDESHEAQLLIDKILQRTNPDEYP